MYRERQVFEKADPNPVAVLGPVPSIQEQTAALMQNPRWLLQQMKMAEERQDPPDLDQFDWEDDEPDILTGYELVEMEPIVIPEDKAEATQTSEGEALMGDSQPESNPSGAQQST